MSVIDQFIYWRRIFVLLKQSLEVHCLFETTCLTVCPDEILQDAELSLDCDTMATVFSMER